MGFEHLKSLYAKDKDLGELYVTCQNRPKGELLIQEGYLFKGTCLCIPKCSTHELLIQKVHTGSMAGHYGKNKTLTMLSEHYYWLGM